MQVKLPKKKKCKVCKSTFAPSRLLQPTCSYDCSVTYAMASVERKKRLETLKTKRETKQKLEGLKTRSDYMKEAQRFFNIWIRERDKAAGHPCISSGKPLDWSGNKVDAGHFRSVGSAPHLRFDERNVHAQSKHDNRFRSGNAIDYRLNLIKRIGLDAVEALEADQVPKHYTIDDLKAIKVKYKQLTKELKDAIR